MPEPSAQRDGVASILLVEDDAGVRSLARTVLERSGYRVLPAEDGRHALELLSSADATIDLLLTDVVMPIMTGAQMAEIALSIRPDLPIVFISAHIEDAVVRQLMRSSRFLQKPFTPEQLRNVVRDALAARPG